jgi:hypothetical protein
MFMHIWQVAGKCKWQGPIGKGIFWMQDHDFQRVFTNIYVAKLPRRDHITPAAETRVARRAESVWDEEEHAWVLPVGSVS